MIVVVRVSRDEELDREGIGPEMASGNVVAAVVKCGCS